MSEDQKFLKGLDLGRKQLGDLAPTNPQVLYAKLAQDGWMWDETGRIPRWRRAIEIDYGVFWSKTGNPMDWSTRARVSWRESDQVLYYFTFNTNIKTELARGLSREQVEAVMRGWADETCPFYGNLDALRGHIQDAVPASQIG